MSSSEKKYDAWDGLDLGGADEFESRMASRKFVSFFFVFAW
jgi:hypothetical protein